MNRVEIADNDVYFMEVLKDMILINNNYSGLILFNSNLEQICRLEVIEGLSIYSSYIHEKEVLLFCPENKCFVYVDFSLNKKKIILLKEFQDWIFSPLYVWCQSSVLLSDYKGNFVNVDLKKEKISMVNIHDTVYQRELADIEKLREYQVYKIFSEKKKALVYFQNLKVGLIDYNQDIKVLKEFKKENCYDFEWADGYTAKISEKKIEIFNGNNIITYNPSKNYNILRGKIMNFKGNMYVYILNALKSNDKRGKIERMELCCDNCDLRCHNTEFNEAE